MLFVVMFIDFGDSFNALLRHRDLTDTNKKNTYLLAISHESKEIYKLCIILITHVHIFGWIIYGFGMSQLM